MPRTRTPRSRLRSRPTAPPRGTTLLGYVPAEGLISAPLSDPDGDGVYTGSVDVPRFAPGPRPPGTEPVSVPVLMGENVGDNSGNVRTIKDFGQVKLDGDKSFSASASFCGAAQEAPSAGTGAGSGQHGSGGGYTGPATDPPASAEPTVSFELKTDCAPPAGTTFYGLAGQEPAQLSDPDGDGVYTGSLTLPAGFYDQGAFAMPVWITTGDAQVPNQQTIKSFGKVVLEDGDAFSADASFCNGGSTGGSTSGGTDIGNGGGVVSGDASDANKGGSVDAGGSGSVDASSASSSSGGAAARGSASPAAKAPSAATSAPAGGVVSSAAKALPPSVANVLPSTGGLALPAVGLAGLLIVGGLLLRRIFR